MSNGTSIRFNASIACGETGGALLPRPLPAARTGGSPAISAGPFSNSPEGKVARACSTAGQSFFP